MAEPERLTITLPAELADGVRKAVEEGDFSSADELVQAALRDWTSKRDAQIDHLKALQADIDAGLADVAAGRVEDFDTDRIVARGRRQLADRSPSA
jgi:antitoxin ParD1/3/4